MPHGDDGSDEAQQNHTTRTAPPCPSESPLSMVDEKNRRLDFHALRHTFQTQLDRVHTSRAVKKGLMRHAASDVTDGYAHAELLSMFAAISRLASPLNPPEKVVELKTGTDALPVGSGRPTGRPKVDQPPAETVSDTQSDLKKNLIALSPLSDEQIAESLCKMSEEQALRISQLIAASSPDNVLHSRPSTQVD